MQPPASELFIPYPCIADHGVIGDRRTAALVASDGTIDWFCAPCFDGEPLLAALLDARKGGRFRLGPRRLVSGQQAYEGDTALLTTRWEAADGVLELTDVMGGPADRRIDSAGPCIVRRLRCTRGRVRCGFHFAAASGVGGDPSGHEEVRLWTTFGEAADFELGEGEEAWAVLSVGRLVAPWSTARAQATLGDARAYWRTTMEHCGYDGPHAGAVRRATLVVRLLTYAPTGAVVAAATLGLPERLGGARNYDYRYAWIRDASLALGVFARLGDDAQGTRFLDWLVSLETPSGRPLQVCYGIRGERRLPEAARKEMDGYRGSRPVLFGNRAYQQKQLGSLGYLADCAWQHLQAGGTWKPAYDELVTRCADHTERVWEDDDSGVWELAHHAPFTMSKVMCWAVLDRAVRITERTGGAPARDRQRWIRTAAKIHADVLARAWDAERGTFVQRYDRPSLDASLLLLPLMGFLPPDDPRVTATVARIEERLMIDGFVYRFVPADETGEGDLPVGDFEASFLPCLFWLASAHALAGRVAEAQTTLERALGTARGTGLFAEEYDPRTTEQVGNYPQLFTHAECVRAVLDVDAAVKRGAGVPAPLPAPLGRGSDE